MAIMISINKPHTDNIFAGRKTNEWRTKPLPIGKAYVYETKRGGGCGKVIGEIEIVKTYRFHTSELVWQDTLIEQGCVPYNFVANYAKGKEYISANIIVNAKRYKEPKELGAFCKIGAKGMCELEDLCDYCPCEKKHVTSLVSFGQRMSSYSSCDGLYCDYAYRRYKDDNYAITRPPQSWQFVEEI